jgi:hypothetical protein
MSSISLVAGFYFTGLWWLFRQWRSGRSSGQFVLGLLPTALLFLTVPIPITVWELMQGFQRIGEQGLGGLAVVAPFCLGIARGCGSVP